VTDRPNVLFVCVDDMNDYVGFLGGIPTRRRRTSTPWPHAEIGTPMRTKIGAMHQSHPLTVEQRRELADDGYTVVDGILPDDDLARLRTEVLRVREVMAARGETFGHALERSVRSLQRLSRACYGCGLAAAHERLRLERAAGLLLTTDEPVAALAARCGYADATDFSRAFRRVYRAPPGSLAARPARTRRLTACTPSDVPIAGDRGPDRVARRGGAQSARGRGRRRVRCRPRVGLERPGTIRLAVRRWGVGVPVRLRAQPRWLCARFVVRSARSAIPSPTGCARGGCRRRRRRRGG